MKEPHFILGYDVYKAHRQVPVAREEWGMQACRCSASSDDLHPNDTLYLNTCGTFGAASAPYWWSRLMGHVMRVVYYICGESLQLYQLVYVDDGLLIGSGPFFERSIMMSLLIFSVFKDF